MKHVFVIHSHITFLISVGTINKLGLTPNDVIFLYGRNYHIADVNIPYTIYDISSIYRPAHANDIWHPTKRKKYVERVDNFVNNNIGNEFYVYLPHTGFTFFQLLLTHPLCKGINLIQEGAVSYFKKRLKWKSVVKNIILFPNKRIWFQSNWNIPKRFYFEKEIVRTFAINDKFFSKLRRAENYVVKIPTYDLKITIDEKKPIFVFETAVEVQLIEREIYMAVCKKLITECAKQENYIKFHPNQSEENKQTIRSFFGEKQCKDLPMDIPFELILSSYKHLTVCGFTSSLMFFAKDMGHTTINYTKELTSKSRKFAKYVASMCHE